MRNLKRALSLALASVMLLGMMVVGTSAASTSNFTDADKIVNAEAVDLTTGLDIFKGYTDGSFGPDKAVSRAEAAVVIAKILHGSDVNPANFAGAGKFNDVAPWAEGYVNLVASLGIIVGVGENQFAPDRTVSTVEFSTMLLKALGYYVEADALGADWMLEVTSKANALGLYGDLELAMTAPLTRENVAVMTMNALFAQRVAYDDVRGLYVKNSDRNVVVTNGTKDEMNTLAQNTYGLYAVEGLVVANGMTDMYLEDKTEVVFDEEKDVTGDGKVEAGYSFKTETGLDMIGHAVTVYYTIEKKAPVVYAVVDEATLAVATTMTDNLSTLAKAEGFAKDTSDTVVVYNYDLENDITATYDSYENEVTYLISNSSDLTVDYAIVVKSTLAYIDDILVNDADEDDVILTYTVAGGTTLDTLEDDKNVIALNEVEEEDYVLVTMIEDRAINGGDLYLIEAAETEIETIVTVTRKNDDTKKLASEAVEYVESITAIEADIKGVSDQSLNDETDVIAYEDVLMEGEYVLIYDTIDRLIGVVPVEIDTTVNTAYVAQFGTKINTDPTLFDDYALYAHVYFADGTDGVYTVDTGKFTGNAFRGTATSTGFIFNTAEANLAMTTADGTTQTNVVKNNSTAAGLNNANGEGFGDYIRLYDVQIQDNGKVRIKELPGQGVKSEAGEWVVTDTYTFGTVAGVEASLSQIKKGVTWMGHVSAKADDSFYGNSKTTFFFVDGDYDTTASHNGITVSVVTGMANVPTIDLADTTKDNYGVINQAAATEKTGYKAVDSVLVNNYQFEEVIDGLYYYDGVYTIKDMKDDTFDLTFTVYDFETGEKTTVTYEGFDSDADARAEAKLLDNGYYTVGTTASDCLEVYWVNASNEDKASGDDNTYVVDTDFIRYIDQGDVLTMYTDNNNYEGGVTVTEETIFVDLTGNGLTSLETMDRLIKARDKIWVQNDSTYTTGDETATLVYDFNDKNNVGVIYVVGIIGEYDKDYTGAGIDTASVKLTTAVFNGKTVKPAGAYATAAEAAVNAKTVNIGSVIGGADMDFVGEFDTASGRVSMQIFGDLDSVEDFTTGSQTATGSANTATVSDTAALTEGDLIVVRVNNSNGDEVYYAFVIKAI